MDLHAWRQLDERRAVLRVPDGWIYEYYEPPPAGCQEPHRLVGVVHVRHKPMGA